jgi:hypothetical protein
MFTEPLLSSDIGTHTGTRILTGGIYDVFHLNYSGVMTHTPNFIRTGSESFRSLMGDAQT